MQFSGGGKSSLLLGSFLTRLKAASDAPCNKGALFAVNKRAGPGSKLFHGGFERPSHCQFGPDGVLYVVDFGIIHIAPEAGSIRQQLGSGTLWRIRRTDWPQGSEPAKPARVPIYLLQGIAILAGAVGAGVLSAKAIKKLRGDGDHRH